jgi:hypothetical protein
VAQVQGQGVYLLRDTAAAIAEHARSLALLTAAAWVLGVAWGGTGRWVVWGKQARACAMHSLPPLQNKEKVNNQVLFDKPTYEKLLAEVPKYKMITQVRAWLNAAC